MCFDSRTNRTSCGSEALLSRHRQEKYFRVKLNFELKSFKTRVARRVFLLFIVCAIVPVTILGMVSYRQVKYNMDQQHHLLLRQESRSVALSIYERLLMIQNELIALSETRTELDSLSIPVQGRWASPRILSLYAEKLEAARPITDNAFSLEIADTKTFPTLLMRYRDSGTGTQLVARLNTAYLWEASERLPQDADFIIIQTDGPVLFASSGLNVTSIRSHLVASDWARNGAFTWTGNEGRYDAGYARIFLEPLFKSPSWMVVVITPATQMKTLMADFKLIFPALIIFSLGLVVLLGQYLIRRSTDPIETLQDGTRRIAAGEFGYEVDIRSGDEFEELGRSFNEMSRKLDESKALIIRAARMGTMGQMASGIVHEVKQPLSAIYGHVQLALMDPLEQRTIESLRTVLTAVEALDVTLNRFRSFSQDAPMALKPLALNAVVEEVITLLNIRFKKCGVPCRLELAPGLPKILADRRGVQQILSNLLINALDALEETQSEAPAVVVATRLSTAGVMLEVSDNAGGIPTEIQDKIFDPFFSTKTPEKGTGLGMAIIETIVHQHDADIILDSTPGEGTKIRITFRREEERTAE